MDFDQRTNDCIGSWRTRATYKFGFGLCMKKKKTDELQKHCGNWALILVNLLKKFSCVSTVKYCVEFVNLNWHWCQRP